MCSGLAQVFEAVRQVVSEKQLSFNAADEHNHNHGDHMVEIFDAAVQSLHDDEHKNLAEAMLAAGAALKKLGGNASASIYADALTSFAHSFNRYDIEQAELVRFVRSKITEARSSGSTGKSPDANTLEGPDDRSGIVLKALVEGLSTWKQAGNGENQKGKSLDLGALFELGIIYFQAKQRGGSSVEVLADAAVSASPLNQSPHRKLSGKIAVQAFLKALADLEPDDTLV
jgi:hypothetical protein